MITSQLEGSGDLAVKILKTIIGSPESKSCLDLMCCEGNVTRKVGFKNHFGIDIDPRWASVWAPSENHWRSFAVEDVLNRQSRMGPIDWVVCLDGIEHLTKPQALKLIADAYNKEHPKEGLIFFTPDNASPIEPDSVDPHAHKCQWNLDDLDESWRKALFPNWHPRLGFGAFFFWIGGCTEKELEAAL